MSCEKALLLQVGRECGRVSPRPSLGFPPSAVLRFPLDVFSPPWVSCFSFHPFIWRDRAAKGGGGQWEHSVPRLRGPCAGVTLPSLLSSHQNANGEVTDFLSFYTLPSTIMNHPTHKSLKAAYSFYNVHTQTPLLDLMSDALVLAKMVRSQPEGRGGGAVPSTALRSCSWAGGFKASSSSCFTLGAAQQFPARSSKTRREQGVSTPGEGIELLMYFSEFCSHGRRCQEA